MANKITTRPEETNVRPRSEMDKKMHDTMEAWYQLQDNHDAMKTMVEKWEASHAHVTQENEMLRAQLANSEQRLQYYMRHSTEMATRLVDIQRVIQMAIHDSKVAAFRPAPTGAPPPQPQPQQPKQLQQADDGEEVPRFLTDGQPIRSIEDELRDMSTTEK